MSRSSTPEAPAGDDGSAGLRHRRAGSDDRAETPAGPRCARAQVEPTVALVAVFAVCAGVGLYATALDGAVVESDRDLSRPTLERAHDALNDGGVVDPDALPEALAAGPDGYRVNVTLTTAGRRWTEGPIPPGGADAAARRVSVALGPGRAAPGILRAEVWR